VIVRYTGRGKAGVKVGRFILLLVFIALFAAYLDDDLRQMLSKNNVRGPVTLGGILFFASFVLAISVDIVLSFVTKRRGQPALIMDRDGFQGRIFYRMKRFDWGDLARVSNDKAVIAMKPYQQGLVQLLDMIPTRFGPFNAANSIYFSVQSVDTDREDVLAFVREHAPGVREGT
jgi:hypothetical protein